MQYSDTWNRHIPDSKLAAYKSLIDSGEIRIRRVTYSKNNQTTIVEYDSDRPHGEILDELKRKSEHEKN